MTFKDVASYMGAWIETFMVKLEDEDVTVASYMGAWIETVIRNGLASKEHSRILHGCVD